MKSIIRKAKKEDIPAIFGLVQELALYERAPEAVITSVEIYLQDFENRIFDAHVAEMDGKVVGMILYYMAYSTWKGRMLYLEDFYVQEAYRRYGIGQQLFDTFLEEGRRQDASLVKWQVIDWNDPALQFYEKNSAIIEKEWWNGKIFLK
jgi:GNAT superfamily N-acetyltransferase